MSYTLHASEANDFDTIATTAGTLSCIVNALDVCVEQTSDGNVTVEILNDDKSLLATYCPEGTYNLNVSGDYEDDSLMSVLATTLGSFFYDLSEPFAGGSIVEDFQYEFEG